MANFGINKLKNFVKDHYKFLILFSSLAIVNVFFLCWNFKFNSLSFGKNFIIMLIGSISVEIILCIIIYFSKLKSWKIENIFLILGFTIGVFYLFALPVGRAPDEESHFFRIYEITSGNLTSNISEQGDAGSLQPQDIEIIRDVSVNNITYSELLSNINDQADEQLTFVKTSADSYSIISYLPQTIGMFIGKTLGLPYIISAYIAKLFNLICCLIILYFSIKYIPFLKEFIFFLTFLPINMQALVSLSTDALITVSAIALISFVLYSIYTMKTTFTKKHFFILLTLCTLVSVTKIVYTPLCFMLFAIPKERFGGNSKRKITWIISLGALVILIYFAWRFFAPPIRHASDASTQFISIIQNPFYYIAILLNSISTNFSLYIVGAFGGYLEWFNVPLSMLYIFTSLIIFILLCVQARKYYAIPKSIKNLSISLFILITVIIFTALYISWTKVGEVTIDGVQGRYFLPIMLLIPIICMPTFQKTKKKQISSKKLDYSNHISNPRQNYYLYTFFIFESMYAIISVACTHI